MRVTGAAACELSHQQGVSPRREIFVQLAAAAGLAASFSVMSLMLAVTSPSAPARPATSVSTMGLRYIPARATISRYGIGRMKLAVAMNVRGGPGIVLATIVYEAGIISPSLFTALVVTAVVTSQLAGWWLDRAIRNRHELMGEPVGSDASTPRVLEPRSRTVSET